MAETKKGTKVKKMAEEKAVAVAETKEVDFGDGLELRINKPTLNTDKTLSISGNFSELGSKIQAVVDRYKGVQLTEDNVSYVKTLKGQFASLRTGIERERKEYQKVYITPAKKLIDSMCDELQSIVAEGEKALGDQLDAYDQKRKDELTIILKEYVADSVAKHNLREEYASQIQLIDKYYSKSSTYTVRSCLRSVCPSQLNVSRLACSSGAGYSSRTFSMSGESTRRASTGEWSFLISNVALLSGSPFSMVRAMRTM